MRQILLPYQQRWIGDRSRTKLMEKSRQVGVSWCTAGFMALSASRRNGKSCWYIGYNREMAKEFIIDAAQWARAMSATIGDIEEGVFKDDDDSDCDILTFSINFASGWRITALSSRPRSLRNKRGHIVIDEAAFHDDLAGLVKSARGNYVWGGDVWIMSTHNGIDSQFNAYVEDCRAGRLNYSIHRVTLDDAIADGLYQRIAAVTGLDPSPAAEKEWRDELISDAGDDADEEFRVIPRRSGGTYLPRPLVESCMYRATVLRYEAEAGFALLSDEQRAGIMLDWLKLGVLPLLQSLDKEKYHALGEDFGRTADITVFAPVAVNQNLSKTIPFMVELRNVPFREQELALTFILDRLPRFFYAAIDAGGNGQYLAERAWQRYGGDRIEQVTLNEKWYGEQFPKLKASLEDQQMAIPKDADVLADLQTVRVIDGIPRIPSARTRQKAESKTKRARRHADAAVAIVLGHYASEMEIRQYGYESIPGRSERKGLD